LSITGLAEYLPLNLLKNKGFIQNIIKKHSKPTTSYQILLESKHISEAKKQELTEIYNQLNPIELKKRFKKNQM